MTHVKAKIHLLLTFLHTFILSNEDNSALLGMNWPLWRSPAYKKLQCGPMVQHYCHGVTISTHATAVQNSLLIERVF